MTRTMYGVACRSLYEDGFESKAEALRWGRKYCSGFFQVYSYASAV